MDTATAPHILVHISPHQSFMFRQCESGLFYYDTAHVIPTPSPPTTQLAQTVAGNKEHYTRREIEGADAARELQSRLGWPSTATLIRYLQKNQIINCPMTIEDVKRGEAIYGPQIPLLKGKMVRKQPPHVRTIQRVNIPHTLSLEHPTDELDVDHFFVNGLTFLHTKSRKIKFLTAEHCKGTTTKEALEHIQANVDRYARRGFEINGFIGDNAFAPLKEVLEPFHIVSKGEHVPTIERSIRTLKERCRCTTASLPYSRYPRAMTR